MLWLYLFSKNCISFSKIHRLCSLLYRIIWKLSSFESVLMYYETLKGYLLLTVLKSAPGQNSKCFCLKALEIPLRKISISCRRKLLSQQERYTQLDWIQEIFLRWYFYFSLFGGDGMNEGWIEQNGYTFSALTNVQSFRLFWTQKICITVAKGK